MASIVLERRHELARRLMTVYGVAVYAGFLALFVSVICFVEGIAAPRGIDDGRGASMPVAVTIDLALLTLFAAQHSVMARSWFKRWWTQFVPPAIERSTYVLASNVVLALLVWQWRAMPGTVWSVGVGPWQVAVTAVSFAGWALVLGSTFLVHHFDMFGVRQVVRHQRGLPPTSPPFQTRLLYRVVRHPLLLGVVIAVWAAPTMSLGHLLFAGAATAYIVLGARLEERDLTEHFGDRYRRYRREVPMLVPGLRPSPEAPSIRPADGAQVLVRELVPPDEESIRLSDGAQVLVRELVPSDEESIRDFYLGLSPSTLAKRFLTPYATLPESMLRHLAVAGQPDRCVIVGTHGGVIVGEARFHRAGTSDAAEVAVVVADDWQGRGLGTELVRRLGGLASARGLSVLTGTMRADNRAAVGLLSSLAPTADRRMRSGEVEFQVPAPGSAAPILKQQPEPPSTIGRNTPQGSAGVASSPQPKLERRGSPEARHEPVPLAGFEPATPRVRNPCSIP